MKKLRFPFFSKHQPIVATAKQIIGFDESNGSKEPSAMYKAYSPDTKKVLDFVDAFKDMKDAVGYPPPPIEVSPLLQIIANDKKVKHIVVNHREVKIEDIIDADRVPPMGLQALPYSDYYTINSDYAGSSQSVGQIELVASSPGLSKVLPEGTLVVVCGQKALYNNLTGICDIDDSRCPDLVLVISTKVTDNSLPANVFKYNAYAINGNMVNGWPVGIPALSSGSIVRPIGYCDVAYSENPKPINNLINVCQKFDLTIDKYNYDNKTLDTLTILPAKDYTKIKLVLDSMANAYIHGDMTYYLSDGDDRTIHTTKGLLRQANSMSFDDINNFFGELASRQPSEGTYYLIGGEGLISKINTDSLEDYNNVSGTTTTKAIISKKETINLYGKACLKIEVLLTYSVRPIIDFSTRVDYSGTIEILAIQDDIVFGIGYERKGVMFKPESIAEVTCPSEAYDEYTKTGRINIASALVGTDLELYDIDGTYVPKNVLGIDYQYG